MHEIETLVAAVGILVAVAAAIKALDAGVTVISKWWGRAIGKGTCDIMEARVKHAEECLGRDDCRLKELEEGQAPLMRGILALTEHALNGNNYDELKDAKAELEQYLIKR